MYKLSKKGLLFVFKLISLCIMFYIQYRTKSLLSLLKHSYWSPLYLTSIFTIAAASDKSKVDIFLMGDSVLDNFHWLGTPKQNLTQQLKDLGYNKTHNYAVDASQIKDIRQGIAPADTYTTSRTKHGLDPYPTHSDGLVKPLDLLKKQRQNDMSSRHQYILLSIGGNDVALGNDLSYSEIIKKPKK